MIFDLNIKKLAVLLLPTFLRKPAQIKWLWALLKPLENIYDFFVLNRKENIYKLSHNSQICYLQKALNDKFDVQQRRIYIIDGNRFERLYIYTEGEQIVTTIFTEDEIDGGEIPVYLYADSDYADTGVDFIVRVPADIFNLQKELEIRALVNYYKLASKRYKIETF